MGSRSGCLQDSRLGINLPALPHRTRDFSFLTILKRCGKVGAQGLHFSQKTGGGNMARISWQRVRALEVALAVVKDHSTNRQTCSVNIRPHSFPTVGRGFLVNLLIERSGQEYRVFVKKSVLRDTEVRAWWYKEEFAQSGERTFHYLESVYCDHDSKQGWIVASHENRVFDERIIASFRKT